MICFLFLFPDFSIDPQQMQNGNVVFVPNYNTRWGRELTFTPWPLYSLEKRIRYRLVRRLSGRQNWSGHWEEEEISCPVGNGIPLIHTAGGCYTDWAIWAHTDQVRFQHFRPSGFLTNILLEFLSYVCATCPTHACSLTCTTQTFVLHTDIRGRIAVTLRKSAMLAGTSTYIKRAILEPKRANLIISRTRSVRDQGQQSKRRHSTSWAEMPLKHPPPPCPSLHRGFIWPPPPFGTDVLRHIRTPSHPHWLIHFPMKRSLLRRL
jgi:hypothetical protein